MTTTESEEVELGATTVPPIVARAHTGPHGAHLQPDGQVRFSLWAPACSSVFVELEGTSQPLPMNALPSGWHEITTDQATTGSLYTYRVLEGDRVPDPASRFQPRDVGGPSEVIDPNSFPWKDADWEGRQWSEAVLYELHIGSFTPEGTFLATIEKLDHLVELGITGIEIMPVGDFAGERNWGYDGVLIYAPDSSYGRPEDLKQLIQEAHLRGLMVLLDVVYNHFGPEGNYLPKYAPQVFTDHHKTPWGDAVNFDSDQSEIVREFIIHNALYWIEEYNLDGLRLDAVHAIKDDSTKHLLDELAERVRAASAQRPVHLILENESNQAFRLARDESGQPRTYTAQWNDDMHHVLHTAATLETNGYYGDYTDDTEKLGRALAQGFAFQGEVMEATGSTRGEPSSFLTPLAFVAFMQNHDQIGNRAFGERINAIASPEAVHAIASIYLLLPQVPMLFMGEEWGSSQPFPFFCDFKGELADLVRKGRRQEFAKFPEFQDPEQRERIPDPLANETFLAAKLDWAQAMEEVHAEWLDWYRRILRARREYISPFAGQLAGHAAQYNIVEIGAVVVRFSNPKADQQLVLAANLSDKSNDGFPEPTGSTLWQEGPEPEGSCMRPWSVRWSLLTTDTDEVPEVGQK